MKTRQMMNCSAMLLGATAAGAALMYLLDPQAGGRRRKVLKRSARDTLTAAEEELSDMYSSLSHSAQQAGRRLGQKLSHSREQAHAMIDPIRSRALGVLPDRVSSHWSHLDVGHRSPGWGSLSFVGAALTGAVFMYIFDPTQGHRRRARMHDQGRSMMHHAADRMRHTGQHAAGTIRGAYHSVRQKIAPHASDDWTLEARIRSEMGHVVSAPSGIHVQTHEGRVTLSGTIDNLEHDALVRKIRAVPGVRQVVDQLN